MTGYNNIILIDDDPVFNFINTEIIKTAKPEYIIKSFEHAESALNELNTIKVDDNDFGCIIFLDINMPKLNGWDFLERYIKLPARLINACRVFMLSSSNSISDIEKSKTYDVVDGFISKPLTIDQAVDISAGKYSSIGFQAFAD